MAEHVRQRQNGSENTKEVARMAADYAKSLQRLANEFDVKRDKSGRIDWLSLLPNEAQFRKEVEGGIFPAPEHTYQIEEPELQKLLVQLRG